MDVTRKGRKKANVAGEVYNSNAVPNQVANISSRKEQFSNVAGDVDFSRWKILYPNYIDGTKTVANGRRLKKEIACDSPTATEIAEVCHYLKIAYVLEPYKRYPRDFLVQGRVRVKLDQGSGNLMNDEISSVKVLMANLGMMIPKLQSRKERLARLGALSKSSNVAKKKGKKKGKK